MRNQPRDPQTEAHAWQAEKEGRHAARHGRTFTSPYPEGTPEGRAWIDGWHSIRRFYEVEMTTGRRAFENGVSILRCPYTDREQVQAWVNGWCDARDDEARAGKGRKKA